MKVGVLVLAAGKSTRIAGISGGRPKPLLRFGGRRLIEWNLTWLAAHGIDAAWVNLHYRADEVRAAVGDGAHLGVRVRYSPEPELLGTAGAWKVADAWRGTSLVLYGDNVMRFDLERFLAAHRRSGALATVALFDPARHANTGIAGGHVVIDKEGRIIEFREGATPRPGRSEYVNAGAYLLEPELLDHIPPGFRDFGRDIFPPLLASGRIHGHVLEDGGFCLGLDTPESFAAGEALLRAGKVTLG